MVCLLVDWLQRWLVVGLGLICFGLTGVIEDNAGASVKMLAAFGSNVNVRNQM